MTDSRPLDPANTGIDPERRREANAFDKDDHFTGQTFHRDAEAAEGERAREPLPAPDTQRDLPPDNGRRASVAADGSVRGSGVGAGGGSPGEDMDSSSASGDSNPVTGGEGGDGRPQGLGPAPTGE
jgi:hypothetical protein